MPTQLPLEATVFFGSRLLPLIPKIIEVDAKKDFQTQTNIAREIRDVSQTLQYFSDIDQFCRSLALSVGDYNCQWSIDTQICLYHSITRTAQVLI